MEDKKAGWYAVLEDSQMPAMSTLLDQAHNAMDRKLFAMKGFHHRGGSQAAFLTGLAHLYNLIPYQRRAKNAGLCGVEVEGGRVVLRKNGIRPYLNRIERGPDIDGLPVSRPIHPGHRRAKRSQSMVSIVVSSSR